MDILLAVFTGMIVGAWISLAVTSALTAYHSYQRDVNKKLDNIKKDISEPKEKNNDESVNF